jgi:AAA domain, putative AbiEii toxin, Type IV TA system
VVKEVLAKREGTVEELTGWLIESAAQRRAPAEGSGFVSPTGVFLRTSLISQIWTQDNLIELSKFFVLRADAEARLRLASSVNSVDAAHGEASNPLQRLLKSHAAELRLSKAVKSAFNVEVCVNRAGGSQLSLHLGRPLEEARLDNPEYLAELKELPLVSEQGDGMRAFIGLMMTLSATDYPVVLIDEPEAFLHPPQAGELGRQLAASSTQQRFIATHSADVLLGLLDGEASLVVIRLRRGDCETVASVLDHEHISALWQDASLRYSNLLDGLFHSGVVVCEADGDARLYAAALDD